MKLYCNKNDPLLGGILAAEYAANLKNIRLEVSWGEETAIESCTNKVPCETDNELLRTIARLFAENELYGSSPLEKTEVDHWLTLSISLASKSDFPGALSILDKALGPSTYLACKKLTLSDFAVFAVLYRSNQWQDCTSQPVNVLRWFNFIKSQDVIKKVLDSMPQEARNNLNVSVKPSRQSVDRSNVGNRAREGKYVDLPGAEMGKVVVRFPPEASGYLHIGHAKAALLNQYYQEAFQGKLIMRFDDTNPAKENVHFEQVILEDVAKLEIKPDLFTHTSQYFDLMLDYCEKLLKEGKAYVDDTDPETMKAQREQKIESAGRSRTYEQNLSMWQEMKKGSPKGQQCCVRAKIDMQSPNGCMRDPTIYRCKNEIHPRTGDKYKVYPTYDFACPIVDVIEGVTHVLRTMEYHDRDPQFFWFIEALGLRKPYIWEYSRLSMTNTVLSKRKLTWFVNEKLVDGWDDPRMPTVRGVLRRGMTVQGLKEFIIAQGSSKSVVFMEWDKIWAFNKKVIDPIAPRYTALDKSPVTVIVKGAKEECLTVSKHPKNSDVGTKPVWISSKILIDRADAESLKEGENATFINWGNLLIKKINRENGTITSVEAELNLDNKDYKKTLKLTWLADTHKAKFTPVWCVYFDHIISKPLLGKDEDFKQFIGHETRKEVEMIGDPELKNLKEGDIIELQRRGFFRVDVPYQEPSLHSCKPQPVVLFYIPDGRATKDSPASGKPTAATPAPSKKDQLESKPVLQKAAETKSAIDVNAEIVKQGEIVRDLKAQKAPKDRIDGAVKVLLALKAEYKDLTGVDWKPGCVPPTSNSVSATTNPTDLDAAIQAQGDKVRKLKSEKAQKAAIDVEVKALLALKQDYKKQFGKDWAPISAAPLDESALLLKITSQGDKVRDVKAKKADKSIIDAEVKVLLALKTDYKALTGKDWKPGTVTQAAPVNDSVSATNLQVDENRLLQQISEQGDKVRRLKSDKADKKILDEAIKTLLALKSDFKSLTGKDWKVDMKPAVNDESINGSGDNAADELTLKINEQANVVRDLKSKKASKDEIDSAVKTLLQLKSDYKTATGIDFPTAGRQPNKPKEAKPAAPKPAAQKQAKQAAKEKKPVDADDGAVKKQTRLGLEAKKEENLADWYSQVITKGELIEYYDVSGCYILRPWSFAIWETIRDWFDSEIKKLGVQNCYFPIFVSRSVLEKEKTHIADFAPEVAWVTKSGDSDLAEPIAIRPTSETVMYPAYAKWIQSYRDLPIKLNQWNNVVRWEFKHPQPFLRTREFLWQEGHTAYAAKQEATDEVKTILDLYGRIYTDLLAIPVIKGRKTEKEKFAGGDYTLTVEAFISASGRAIQGATSHHLGQNFSKMFEIVYEDPETQEKEYVYQNSWGLTTRTIGVLVMVHADNQGLVLPPRVASIQAVIVPCGITVGLSEAAKSNLQQACDSLEAELKQTNIRVKGDYRLNYSPGWKFNHWELKGVPIRLEVGPKDIEKKQIVAVRRDTGEKITLPRSAAVQKISELLNNIQTDMLKKANDELSTNVVTLKDWSQFTSNLDSKKIILAPFCGDMECEDKIKADSQRDDSENAEPGAPSMGAKSLCIPLEQPAAILGTDKCIHHACSRKPQFYTLFGRSY